MGRNESIVILEKDHLLRTLYRVELEDEGYITIFADDERDALEKIDAFSPDLFITNYHIPPSGFFIDMLRHTSEKEQIPIIINTAYPLETIDGVSCEVAQYVAKTADLKMLKNKIDVLLHSNNS